MQVLLRLRNCVTVYKYPFMTFFDTETFKTLEQEINSILLTKKGAVKKLEFVDAIL